MTMQTNICTTYGMHDIVFNLFKSASCLNHATGVQAAVTRHALHAIKLAVQAGV